MDEFDRLFSRERARRKAQLRGRDAEDLWNFQWWPLDETEGHHMARAKYGDDVLQVPYSMHQELTRRQMQEHPADGPDPTNVLERLGRLFLGLTDMLECLADLLRKVGESLIAAAAAGRRRLSESDYLLVELVKLMQTIQAGVSVAMARIAESKEA